MDFRKTEEQELLLESMQEFAKRHITKEKVWQWYEDGGVPDDIVKAYLDAGFGYLGLPEEVGGTPATALTRCMVIEEICRLSGAMLPFMQNSLAMFDVVEFGTPEQIKFCMDLYRETGKAPFSLAISEPGAGSDNMGMTTTAKTTDGKIVLNGQKTWVTNGAQFPYAMVIAKDEDASPKNKNMSLWLIPNNLPGIEWKNIERIGQQVMPFYEMYLENVIIDESCLLGQRGQGFINLMKNFEMDRCLVASMCLGVAQAAMDDAAAYAGQRMAFGQQIGNFQLIQEKLTDMEIKLRNMRRIIHKACWELDNKMPAVQLDSALVKRYVPKTCVEVCSEALQIFAGIGYTTDARVGRMWIDVRGYQIGAGTDEVMVHIAGRQLIKKYAK